jgi:hypothetical protein
MWLCLASAVKPGDGPRAKCPSSYQANRLRSHPAGGNCRVDSLSGYMSCSSDNSTTSSGPGGEFSLVGASSLSPLTGLSVNSAVLIKNVLTGQYCRVVTRPGVPVDESQQIKCDVSDPSQATSMVFNGTYITTQQGQPITNPCGSCPVYLGGIGTPASIQPGEPSEHLSTTAHSRHCCARRVDCYNLCQPH